MANFTAATGRLGLLAALCGLSLGCAGDAAGTGSDLVVGEPGDPRRAAPSGSDDGRSADDSRARDTRTEGTAACDAPVDGVPPGSSVATTHRLLWRLPTPEAALVQGIVKDGTLYLRDNRASIWRLGEDQTEATLLYAPQPAMSDFSGALVADDDYLYWSEAAHRDGERAPPSRVVRMLVTGGPVSVLVESDEDILGAFGADGDQLFVSVESTSFQGLALVSEQGGALSPLHQSLPVYLGRQVGAAVYWTDGPQVGSAPNNLLRAELPGFEPSVAVSGVRGPVFDVGPGYVVTRRGSVEDERLAAA